MCNGVGGCTVMAKDWRPECLPGRTRTCSFFRLAQTPGLAQPPTKWIDWDGVKGAVKLVGACSCIPLPHTLSRRGAYLDTVSWKGVYFVLDRPPSVIIYRKLFLHCSALPRVQVRRSKFKKLTVFRLC